MKYSKQDAIKVISCFQKGIPVPIRIQGYYTKDEFHIFDIEPIDVNGIMRCKIRFKDGLISDCMCSEYMPDASDLIEACFIKC